MLELLDCAIVSCSTILSKDQDADGAQLNCKATTTDNMWAENKPLNWARPKLLFNTGVGSDNSISSSEARGSPVEQNFDDPFTAMTFTILSGRFSAVRLTALVGARLRNSNGDGCAIHGAVKEPDASPEYGRPQAACRE